MYAIIGAGPMGLCSTRQLQKHGIPFVGFELHDDAFTHRHPPAALPLRHTPLLARLALLSGHSVTMAHLPQAALSRP
ncbi:hypothetical protein [Pseudomonas sp. TCU-HL1]|uniref:hypothetical protein n=1 Tax=Pseudomonas sp. TCU-HL1 TaxID=1856685 RepID=UPI0009F1E84E|nr:hypothetical protein [Pseudomonas sp. TCU-HL1]